MIRHWFTLLGPYIKSCHAKDITLSRELTVHLDEVRPGMGALDYRAYLTEIARLEADTPLMIEHLQTQEDYAAGLAHIRGVAAEAGLTFTAMLAGGSAV